MSVDSPAVRVERVLDEEHTVLVSLDPDKVVDALSWALKGLHIQMTLLHNRDQRAREVARQRLIRALSGIALQVTLTPADAEQLSEHLTEAAATPTQCVLCDRLADTDFCGRCIDGGAGTIPKGA